MPIVLNVSAFTTFELGNISITIFATPVVFDISTFALLEFRVVEVTIVTSPTIFDVSAFASFELGNVPMTGLEHSKGTFLHVVAIWVASMARCTSPVVFNVFALRAFFELWHVFLAVIAVPVVLDVAAFAGLECSYLKIAVFT